MMTAKEMRDLDDDELAEHIATARRSSSACASSTPPASWRTPPALRTPSATSRAP